MQTDGLDETTGEHSLVTVVQHKPLPGRRWFGLGWVLFCIAAILATMLVGIPLHTYLAHQARDGRELACRNLIGNTLQDAQAQLNADIGAGLTTVVRRQDSTALLARIDGDLARVDGLGDLRRQATEICSKDPDFKIPPELDPPARGLDPAAG